MQLLTREELQKLLIQAKAEGYYEIFLLELTTGAGASGASSFLGDGNIHREQTVCLYSRSASTTGRGRISARMDAWVLGGWISNSPLIR